MVATYFTAYPEEAVRFYREYLKAQEEAEQYEEELYDRVQEYVGHMKKGELQQALLELLFDGRVGEQDDGEAEQLIEDNPHAVAEHAHAVAGVDAIEEQRADQKGGGGQADADVLLVGHDPRDQLGPGVLVDTEPLFIAKEGKLIHVKDEELDSVEETEGAYHNGVLPVIHFILVLPETVAAGEKKMWRYPMRWQSWPGANPQATGCKWKS